MPVNDHGLEVLRKSATEVSPGVYKLQTETTITPSAAASVFSFICCLATSITFNKLTSVLEDWGTVISLYNNSVEQVRYLVTDGPGTSDWAVEVFTGVMNQENGDQLLLENDDFIFL